MNGELVVWGGDQLSFEALQRRAASSGRTAQRLAEGLPAHFIAFDVLQIDGTELLREPYAARRAALEELFTRHRLTAPWTLCPQTSEVKTTQEWLTSWTEVSGVEGIVLNSLLNLRVEAGQQGGSWCQGGVSTGCRRGGSSRRPECRRWAAGRTWRSARHVRGSGQGLRFCCRPTARSTDG
ncbi:ATP-dependent DNA ligase [Streptomyces phaeolivaceus]|uniref:ATP-dependent DNA ligase n=1 Tax=Streptomyces phaeolivaceus TaxID=2653200 RepID=UPI001D05999C|nr:ATP-dependent DNA ligase [Streptomyces phaeolivaceus]